MKGNPADSNSARAVVESITSMPFAQNTFIAHLEGREDCLVIDPGFDVEQIVATIQQKSLSPVGFLCTHGHADHIAGNASMKQRWPDCPLIIGHGDEYKLTDPVANLSAGFGVSLLSPPADRTVREGERLELAGFNLLVRETPGHSAGHVIFIPHGLDNPVVFGGDMLFAGGIGRFDFPDGSFSDLKASILEKMFTLPDETIVYTGHGPETTIGEERRSNPYVGQDAD